MFAWASCIVPGSMSDRFVTVEGTVRTRVTVAEAPGARAPTLIGRVGLDSVTWPAPLNTIGTTLVTVMLLAVSVPLFVICVSGG